MILMAHRPINAKYEKLAQTDIDISDVEGRLWWREADGVHVRIYGVLVPDYTVDDGFASIPVLIRIIKNFAGDPITLHIDSPGGIVTQKLEELIKLIKSIDDTTAVVEGVCTSAAYMVAASCNSVIAKNITCELGGIGIFQVLIDFSERNADSGVKFIVIRTGDKKGVGADGSYDESAIRYLQERIDKLFQLYLSLINRKIDSSVYDGRVLYTSEALDFGLVDGVIDPYVVYRQSGNSDSETEDDNLIYPKKQADVIIPNEIFTDDTDDVMNLYKNAKNKTEFWMWLSKHKPNIYNNLRRYDYATFLRD